MHNRFVLFIAAALALAIVAAILVEDVTHPARAADPAPKAESLSRSAIRGQHVFVQYCAMCHGDGGQGDGELAAEIKRRHDVSVANLTDRGDIARLGLAGVKAVVTKGGAHAGRSEFMPRWADSLSAGQIEDVAAFVVALPELKPGVTSSTLRGFYRTPPGVAEQGHSVFVHQCVVCHGADAKGDGPMALPILRLHKVQVRDLADHAYFAHQDDRSLFLAISGGGGEVGRSTYMPHWGGYLTPVQIKDLVAYVRVISRTKPMP